MILVGGWVPLEYSSTTKRLLYNSRTNECWEIVGGLHGVEANTGGRQQYTGLSSLYISNPTLGASIPRPWEDYQTPWPNQRAHFQTQSRSHNRSFRQIKERSWGLKFKQFMQSGMFLFYPLQCWPLRRNPIT